MDLVGVTTPEPRPGSAWGPNKCPWGTPQNTISCSLADVMSEQLAKELQLEDEAAAFPEAVSVAEGPFVTGENIDTSSDLMLAQMLQMEFDREYDAQLRREEKKFNGDSKVSISFENYRMVHPYEDSDSSEDEVDWQDTRHDPYRAAKPVPTPKKGFIGKGKDITTKHDEVVCGRKNTARMENFAPGFQVGDGIGMDLKLPNQVFNALKQHAYSEERRSARVHEKKEHSTAEKAVDPKTRLLMYKMVNSGMLETITGCISTGKESVVFHAYGGREDGKEDSKVIPAECALKVFKTTLNEFKNRDKYIKDDFRFKDRFSKLNPRKIIRMWAEKEMHNLTRMQKAGISCPEVVMLKKHILVMSFIGKDQVPAPKLKEVKLSSEDMKEAYYQTLHMMQQLYKECSLVHADLSEYNMLWHAGKVWLIDVSQSVEPTHPHGLEFLFRDCRNVSQFFQKGEVSEALGERDLFNAVSGLNITADNEVDFLAEIEALEKMNEDHVQKNGRKSASFLKDDGDPPITCDE
ncbi:serine/threonine-protein kinase RIO3 isoform X2 [Vombatus ursinus]|uniref:serine/threonine-protein kinase RIO3 isoform X2 n=1 Tax=Vombatus ursinus TaxID=29139 RepID=UPI000FFCF5BE|nr:serine/threonine-protein kinase RIO3 isoform X2 [Vombatus ursinus]XP_027733158.1 serine/threonine-protein kinase RIO3 isoform X2 [Vombatus ursinus]